MQFTGQKAEQLASTACLLARKCNRLARKMAANMRNAICVRTQTSKVPTQDILLVSSLFCDAGQLIELINIKSPSNYNIRSNRELLLEPPSLKTLATLGDRSFASAAPMLWNSLPSYIQEASSVDSFKRLLKTYLFKKAYM